MDDSKVQPPLVPSPDQPVPDEFDLVCEHCGYSLVGLKSNRCPECGAEFDPNALPLARVPWLFRKRLGTWPAYVETVREILRGPGAFATELSRPIRICIADARAFRRRSIRIAVCTCVAAAIMITAMSLPLVAIFSQRQALRPQDWMAGAAGCITAPWGLLMVILLFRLATDLPTFIWRGMESNPIDLAPLHHYASAPLALMPILLVPLAVLLVVIHIGADDFWSVCTAAILYLIGFIILALLWFIPLRFMKRATGCGPRRVLALALYLPVHWLLMFALCWLGTTVGAIVIFKSMEFIWGPW